MAEGASIPRPHDVHWARNIMQSCMGVEAGEKVLIVVDEPLSYVREALAAEALHAGPVELWSYTFPDAMRPFGAYPPALLALATQMDVVVLLLAQLDPVAELPAWVAGRTAIMQGSARFGAGAYIDQHILDHELSADYAQIAARSQALVDWLRGRSLVHITTPLGTDVQLSVAGRDWLADTGQLRGRAVYGNLPAGEVYIAPVEERVDGVVVIDKSLPGLMLPEPVRLVLAHGRVVSIEGGIGAERLHAAITEGEQQPHGAWSSVIGELGIGTNPHARLQGNVMTDEKVLGTIHLALGRNTFMGGKNPAPIHIDGVIGQPTVRVDGDLLLDHGRLVVAL